MFSGLSWVSNRHAERPGNCGSEVFIAEKADGGGDKKSGDTITAEQKIFIAEKLMEEETRSQEIL